MASTDTRSGFRLPWSSNHGQHEDQPTADAAAPASDAGVAGSAEAVDGADAVGHAGEGGATPAEGSPDVDTTPQPDTAPQPDTTGRAAEPAVPSPSSAEEPQVMSQPVTASTPATTQAPRKTSRLIAELVAAMRATAETAREQALSQVQADAAQVVETIRSRSTEGEAELRRRSDEDIAAIRDWSKAEIARIREETDRRISGRKAGLDAELAAHAAAIEERIGDVQTAVTAFETDMAEFFERLLEESDPARLATMAEAMPELPSLAAWAEVDELVTEAQETAEAEPEAEPEAQTEAGVGAEPTTNAEAVEPPAYPPLEAVRLGSEAQAVVETDEPTAAPAEETVQTEAGAGPEAATPEAGTAEAETASRDEDVAATVDSPGSQADAPSGGPWGGTDDSWLREPGRFAAQGADSPAETAGWDDRSGWDDPVAADNRESIMAAMEAEAATAAEGDVEADTEADPDGSTAGSYETESDPEAEAAIAARLDAFSTPEPSLAARLASFLPGGGNASDDEPATTQVVVTGLVSVASIASFKRNLGRMTGVRNVSVASGPDGEFVFTVTHRPDVSFRDTVPTMPGFAARITGGDETTIQVTAHDPETEG